MTNIESLKLIKNHSTDSNDDFNFVTYNRRKNSKKSSKLSPVNHQ